MARKREEEVKQGAAEWMATFSDLMNLLLCFFVLLFSMSSLDAQKYADVAASLSESFSSTVSIFDNIQSDSIIETDTFPKNVKQVDEAKAYQVDTSEIDAKNKSDKVDEEEMYKEVNEKAARELYEEISEYKEKAQLDDELEISMDSNFLYVKLSVSGSVLFDSGKETIKKAAYPILDRIGDILKNYHGNLIKIEGHSDNVPITNNNKYADNMELSYARAYEVWKYMVNDKKLPPEKLEAAGRSQYNPIAQNNTSKGRAKNRRVEFKIYTDLVEN